MKIHGIPLMELLYCEFIRLTTPPMTWKQQLAMTMTDNGPAKPHGVYYLPTGEQVRGSGLEHWRFASNVPGIDWKD